MNALECIKRRDFGLDREAERQVNVPTATSDNGPIDGRLDTKRDMYFSVNRVLTQNKEKDDKFVFLDYGA